MPGIRTKLEEGPIALMGNYCNIKRQTELSNLLDFTLSDGV